MRGAPLAKAWTLKFGHGFVDGPSTLHGQRMGGLASIHAWVIASVATLKTDCDSDGIHDAIDMFTTHAVCWGSSGCCEDRLCAAAEYCKCSG